MYKINFIHLLFAFDLYKLRLELRDCNTVFVLVIILGPIPIFDLNFFELLAVFDGIRHPS